VWRWNWWIVVTAYSIHAGFVVMVVITDAVGWYCMQEIPSLSITVCGDRGVTCYERGGGWSCITIGIDQMICYWSFRFGDEVFGMERVSQ